MATRELSQGKKASRFCIPIQNCIQYIRSTKEFDLQLPEFQLSFQQLLQLKEKKEMDEQFKKAQKPWSKLLLKVNKAKSDYHAACKSEKTAVNIERNAGGDSSLSQDHVSSSIVFEA